MTAPDAPLSTRVAALTGPDMAIDAEVAVALGWIEWPRPSLPSVWTHRAHDSNGVLPRFTGSLDVAMTVFPEGVHAFDLLQKAAARCVAKYVTNSAGFVAALPRYVLSAALRARGL